MPGVQVAQVHRIPADLWIIDVFEIDPQRVTSQDLDVPRTARSVDGTRVVYTSRCGGVVVLDRVSGREVVLTGKEDYGGISCAPW